MVDQAPPPPPQPQPPPAFSPTADAGLLARIDALFRAVDIDRSGEIDLSELRNYFVMCEPLLRGSTRSSSTARSRRRSGAPSASSTCGRAWAGARAAGRAQNARGHCEGVERSRRRAGPDGRVRAKHGVPPLRVAEGAPPAAAHGARARRRGARRRSRSRAPTRPRRARPRRSRRASTRRSTRSTRTARVTSTSTSCARSSGPRPRS